jgi:hypothetical protein
VYSDTLFRSESGRLVFLASWPALSVCVSLETYQPQSPLLQLPLATSVSHHSHQPAATFNLAFITQPVSIDRRNSPSNTKAMIEEEQKAYQEQKRQEHRLRAYDDEIQNLIWATSLLIKCSAFYVAVRGLQIFRATFKPL